MAENPNNRKDPSNIQKDRETPHPRKNSYFFMKKQNPHYKVYGTCLVVAFVLIVAFQNCGKKTGGPGGFVGPSGSPVPTVSPVGDKAVFEFYGVDASQIQSVFWGVRKWNEKECDTEDYTYTTSTNKTLEISWSDVLVQNIDGIEAFVALSDQNCISYRGNGFEGSKACPSYPPGNPGVSTPQQATGPSPTRVSSSPTPADVTLSPTPISTAVTALAPIAFLPLNALFSLNSAQFRFNTHTSPSEPLTPTFLKIQAIAPDDDNDPNTIVIKDYFPVGTDVDFLASESTDFTNYEWSIKQLFETTGDISVTNNTQETFSHTFATRGLYEVSVSATDSNGTVQSDSQKILIGLCEGEEKAVELILSERSFGDSTPAKVKQYPIINYIRPDDTDPNHPIIALSRAGGEGGSSLAILDGVDTSERIETSYYTYRHLKSRSGFFAIYKYNRTSSTKFIAIDFLNVDSYQCFFDDNPDEETIGKCTLRGCPESNPDCNACWENTEYTRRSELQPLESCRGKVYDMGSIDTDITECTEDVFLFDFVKADSSDPSFSGGLPFYKYCAANSQYCYFGPEYDRPDEHHCSSSSR